MVSGLRFRARRCIIVTWDRIFFNLTCGKISGKDTFLEIDRRHWGPHIKGPLSPDSILITSSLVGPRFESWLNID